VRGAVEHKHVASRDKAGNDVEVAAARRDGERERIRPASTLQRVPAFTAIKVVLPAEFITAGTYEPVVPCSADKYIVVTVPTAYQRIVAGSAIDVRVKVLGNDDVVIEIVAKYIGS
jgi:hypothetical protein